MRLQEYVAEFTKLDLDVNQKFISRIFKDWRWSLKVPNRVQLRKYTWKNIWKYAMYMCWISFADFTKVKFMDEAHFVSRKMVRKTARAPINERVIVMENQNLEESYSLSILVHYERLPTSQDDSSVSVFAHMRTQSNTQWDFFNFVIDAIFAGHLTAGDTLVVDNASVHTGLDMLVPLDEVCQAVGITIFYLPAYSPELNPCELVFGWLKNKIRGSRHSEVPVWFEVATLLALIPQEMINSFFEKCSRF